MTMLEKLIAIQETEAANAERLNKWRGLTKYDVKCYDYYGRICLITGYWADPDTMGMELLKEGYIVISYWKAVDTLAKRIV